MLLLNTKERQLRMKTAIYPGSFDPVTKGHLDIISRSARMTDKLIVAVLNNNSKSPLFSVEERVNMLKEVTKDIPNVEIDSFSGLLVDYAQQKDATIIVRGLRAVTDFEYELQMAQTNRIMEESVDTIFLTTSLKYAYLSSSIVKEVALNGGEVGKFVPEYVVERIREKLRLLNQG
jgi:pantetheine-phosphate adenylyltransferase